MATVSLPYTGTQQALVQFGSGSTVAYSAPSGDTNGIAANLTFADTSDFWLKLVCTTSGSECGFPAGNDVVSVGALALTLHDTNAPTVSSSSTLATPPTTQAISYSATDTGSGIDDVAMTVGSQTVGDAKQSCDDTKLQPCPASVSGTFTLDPTTLAPGTYQVMLKASDASGDLATKSLGSLTVSASQSSHPTPPGTTTVGGPKPGNNPGTKSRLNVKLDVRWIYHGASTRVLSMTFRDRYPPGTTVTINCQGGGCPFRSVSGAADRLGQLQRSLRRQTFHPGQVVIFVITAPRRTAERQALVVRRGQIPRKR